MTIDNGEIQFVGNAVVIFSEVMELKPEPSSKDRRMLSDDKWALSISVILRFN